MFLLNRTFYHFSQSTLTNIHRVLIGQEVGSVPDIFFGPNSWQLAFCTRITLPWHYEEANRTTTLTGKTYLMHPAQIFLKILVVIIYVNDRTGKYKVYRNSLILFFVSCLLSLQLKLISNAFICDKITYFQEASDARCIRGSKQPISSSPDTSQCVLRVTP